MEQRKKQDEEMKKQRYITPAIEIIPLKLQGSLMAVSVYEYDQNRSIDTITNGDDDDVTEKEEEDGTIWFD